MKHFIGLIVFVNLTPWDSFFLVACFVVVFAINVASESFDYFFYATTWEISVAVYIYFVAYKWSVFLKLSFNLQILFS